MRTALVILAIALFPAVPAQTPDANMRLTNEPTCAPLGSPLLRTTLYFGLNHKYGNVSDSEWQGFLRTEVTPRFPQGLTVWEAKGQWRAADGRIAREKAKVLLLVHEDTAPVRAALGNIVTMYKKRFAQESVLWETAQVCAAF
jgi:hypothetical protein